MNAPRGADATPASRIDGQGLRVGPPLEQFRGVLTGVPTFDGKRTSLFEERMSDDDGGR
jgi:circadian clock protein KaiC